LDYVKQMTGTLIRIDEDENTRFRFEVWFDYTRQGINLVREGAMLAVPNFASSAKEQHLSILEVVTILPMHYGLGSDTGGYPGFVVEAAKSAAVDWEEQETEATEDTTKIKCVAIPTNFEFVESVTPRPKESAMLQEESNLPMVGSSVRLLDTASTEFVANYGIRSDENTIVAGVLIRDENVRLRVRVQELLKTHFGVFGFTGAGKSNLLSTLVDNLLNASSEPIKIVFFDLMGEYSTLLIDQLCKLQDAAWIALHPETMPQSVMEYFAATEANKKEDALARAVRDLMNTALLPAALNKERSALAAPYRHMLTKNKVRIWREQQMTADLFLEELRPEVFKGSMGNSKQPVLNFWNQLITDFRGRPFTAQLVADLEQRITAFIAANAALTNTATTNLTAACQEVKRQGTKYAEQLPIPPALNLTIPQLIAKLNDIPSAGLYIVQSHDPDVLRHFAWMLGNFTYESRRRTGQITPLVSFVFDEADEFIPQQAKDSYVESRDIAMTLARRGRKFGLGIGIATQRVRYLDTSIMAQPHTYFVSKMPRQTDREVVSQAFGVSEEMFRQTFKFKKGDWLLMSYDATGLEAIPIPIHLPNANDRLQKFFDDTRAKVAAAKASRQ